MFIKNIKKWKIVIYLKNQYIIFNRFIERFNEVIFSIVLINVIILPLLFNFLGVVILLSICLLLILIRYTYLYCDNMNIDYSIYQLPVEGEIVVDCLNQKYEIKSVNYKLGIINLEEENSIFPVEEINYFEFKKHYKLLSDIRQEKLNKILT